MINQQNMQRSQEQFDRILVTAVSLKAEVKQVPEQKLHQHNLTRTTSGLSGHNCDGCSASSLTVSFQCAKCDYDLCSACFDIANKRLLPSHLHALTYTSGDSLENHNCDGCHSKISGVAWRCD